MKKLLLNTYDFFHVRKGLFYFATIAIFVLLGFLASRIKVEENIARMIPVTKQTAKISEIFSHSGFADKIVVKISLTTDTTPEVLTELADSFEYQLRNNYGKYVAEIKTKVSDRTVFDIYNTIHNNLPVYLEEDDYKTIDTLIEPTHIGNALKSDFKIITSPAGLVLKRMIADDPVGISSIALKRMQSLQVNGNYDLYDGYIVTKDKKSLLLFVTSANPPVETAKNSILIDGLDKITDELNAKSKYASISYFGGLAVAVGNARQSKRDTILTLSLTIVLLLLFIGFFFRRKRVPFIMMTPVIFGALFSLAIIAVTNGHISTIALAAGSIVLGIAINYSLHFFSHYKHCGSIKETIADLLVPMTLGSFTTIGSFFCLVFLQSQILRDFGMFAGLSLAGATIFSLVFLPHFIPLQKEHQVDVAHESWFDKVPKFAPKYNAVFVLLILGLTIYFSPKATHVGFDSDIGNLNFMTDKLKASEKKIEQIDGGDSVQNVFIASTGKTLQEALENNEKLLKTLDTAVNLGVANKYSSISKFLPSKDLQQQRIKRWNAYWTTDKKQQLLANLQTQGKELKFSAAAFKNFDNLLQKQYQVATDSDFAPIINAFGKEYLISSDGMETVVNTVKAEASKRPKLYAMLDKDPSTVILDKKLITNKLIEIIYNDFNSILAYSSLLVLFALLFSYGRLELTIITFLPMLISWVWILGIMSVFGIRFNIINIIISTFIFGIGDDFSIFITDGLTRKFSEGKETIASHRVSIFLSATTTIIGLGALIFAKHPAMHSIAVISIIGIFCVVFIGQTIQPFFYNFFVQKRKEKGLAPWTFPALALSSFAFTFFVFGALLLTVIGFVLIYLLPFPKKDTRKLIFHHLLRLYTGSLVYIMLNVRKVHINKHLMDFSKPAIIIANHQSFLDILVIAMQHPKLIMLTNKWTYHSPFFGKVIQMADYFPVMEGINPATDHFADIVKKGYSIVIFPEGTRSTTDKINRFHKGAFYLAEQLNLDIVPLLLHGTGDTMRKGDFMLFNGQMTLKYLPRILPTDDSYGTNYAERTKNISRYFKNEYQILKEEIESPKYFKQRLIMNYIYKGPFLEFFTRRKLKQEQYYESIHKLVPKQGNITVLGSSYGFMCYMLHFLGANRTIQGIELNEEKVDIANNCYSKREQLSFEHADITQHPFEPSDVFVIDGILHHYDLPSNIELFTKLADSITVGGTIIINGTKHTNVMLDQLKDIASAVDMDMTTTNHANGYVVSMRKR